MKHCISMVGIYERKTKRSVWGLKGFQVLYPLPRQIDCGAF